MELAPERRRRPGVVEAVGTQIVQYRLHVCVIVDRAGAKLMRQFDAARIASLRQRQIETPRAAAGHPGCDAAAKIQVGS